MFGLTMSDILNAMASGFLNVFTAAALPLALGLLSAVAGSSFEALDGDHPRSRMLRRNMLNLQAFTLGFLATFCLSSLPALEAGRQLMISRDYLRFAGGAGVILFGLHLTSWPRFLWGRGEPPCSPLAGLLGFFVLGLALASVWSPFVGPVLMSIMILAAAEGHTVQGVLLLLSYLAGMWSPLYLLGMVISLLIFPFQTAKLWRLWVGALVGAVIMLAGILIVSDRLDLLVAAEPSRNFLWPGNLFP